MELNEKRFEYDIEGSLLTKGGYEQFVGQVHDAPSGVAMWIHNRHHDEEKCIYLDVLVEFIEKTQPKAWAKYKKYYGDNAAEKLYHRFEQTVTNQGLIYVLRNGIEDMGIKIKLCYFKPESKLNPLAEELYNANILGCTRQFKYSPKLENTIDMVLSLNGIPIVALELKNQFTGQNVDNAVNQFMYRRSSKEFCFRQNHRFLVYFAVDHYNVKMTTTLKDDKTYFMPFDMGSEGAGNAGGAGNPVNPDGYATSYLWEEVLQKDSLMDIIHRFISYTKGKLIFPRYHQYDVVKKVLADVKENGSGKNYLIEHSAGSGKSNSIAWIAYRLASVHDEDDNPIFNSVIVVTNRIVLDSQLQDTINSFEHVPGLVVPIDNKKSSKDLAQAINDNKRIIICTIQKFPFAYEEMKKISGRNFAIIVDEAHQGQSGKSAATLKKALVDLKVAIKEIAEGEDIEESEVDLQDEYINALIGQGHQDNQSFFAFTATPKGETLELFAEPRPYIDEEGKHGIIKMPFHTYSMRQAIEEGFILDVLSNYTTIKEAFKIIRTSADDPEVYEGKAAKAIFKYYKEHGYTIKQKTEMIMENFMSSGRFKIDCKAKAMIVADSRANAVRYYLAIKDYIKDHPKECKGSDVMVAFSGTVNLDGVDYTEASMNRDEDGHYITTDKKFRKAFHSNQYNILVVANKYQTGFDEPLLHSMYVDKKLRDVNAVQTLSRLNRTCPNKNDVFVLDFENTAEDIKEAFQPFYECTLLNGETDLNHVYDLRNKIKDYLLYNMDDVQAYRDLMDSASKKQSGVALGQLSSSFKPVVSRYNELDENDRYAVRDYIRKFNGAYAYVTQLVKLHDVDLFNEYLFTTQLIKFLPTDKVDIVDIEDKIKLEYASLTETFKGSIILDNASTELIPTSSLAPKKPDKKKDTLQSIIDKVNEKFAGEFSDADRVIVQGIYQRFLDDPDVKSLRQKAKGNSSEMFVKSLFPDKFKEIVTMCYLENNDSFQKLFNDNDFYNSVMDSMAHELYKTFRKDD
ncbi:MAG: type I restriction endonuclease subunit R [Ruminococcaceae bacterium]|nr:type I restriction endonuclease subunit R [Oscillospiraceae bacterium]